MNIILSSVRSYPAFGLGAGKALLMSVLVGDGIGLKAVYVGIVPDDGAFQETRRALEYQIASGGAKLPYAKAKEIFKGLKEEDYRA